MKTLSKAQRFYEMASKKWRQDPDAYRQHVLKNRMEKEEQERLAKANYAEETERRMRGTIAPKDVPGTIAEPRMKGFHLDLRTKGVVRDEPTEHRPATKAPQRQPEAPHKPFGYSSGAGDWGARADAIRQQQSAHTAHQPPQDQPKHVFPWERLGYKQPEFAPRMGIKSWREMSTPSSHREVNPERVHHDEIDPSMIRRMPSPEEARAAGHRPTFKKEYEPEPWEVRGRRGGKRSEELRLHRGCLSRSQVIRELVEEALGPDNTEEEK